MSSDLRHHQPGQSQAAQVHQEPVAPSISQEEQHEVRAELAMREYDQLRGQESSIVQGRFQAAVGALTILSLLAVVPGYALAIGPLMLVGIARYVRGGEASLRIVRAYLREFEIRYGYQGYEVFYDSLDHSKRKGGAVKAVRDILLLCQCLMFVMVSVRLWEDRVSLATGVAIAVITAAITGVSMWLTWRWMKTPPKPRRKKTPVTRHPAKQVAESPTQLQRGASEEREEAHP